MLYRERELTPYYEDVIHVRAECDVASDRLPSGALVVLDGSWPSDRIEGALRRLFPRLSRSARVLVAPYRGSLADSLSLAQQAGFALVGDVRRCRRMRAAERRQSGVLFRPQKTNTTNPSISIVIPARNERGTIWDAVRRVPVLADAETEIVFVEGHSADGTWETIRDLQSKYIGAHRVVAVQQDGHGKADAVRCGISYASGDLVAILDADLTVPPESLREFYQAYQSGAGDFLNGDRMSQPMEPNAMPWLNYFANKVFASCLGRIVGISLPDTLCGTKLFTKRDFHRFMAWRENFGDYDPFGDFDLIVPAARIGLGITSIPVRYGARRYGTTQIHRFSDGLKLLRMCWRVYRERGS